MQLSKTTERAESIAVITTGSTPRGKECKNNYPSKVYHVKATLIELIRQNMTKKHYFCKEESPHCGEAVAFALWLGWEVNVRYRAM